MFMEIVANPVRRWKMRAVTTLSEELGFDRSWLWKVVRQNSAELEEKGVIRRRRKGRKTFWYVVDEDAMVEWLEEHGYYIPALQG